MATAKKTAKAVPAKKPVAPVVVAKSDAPEAATYRVIGRINHNGETLRPADPATGREADTVELTEREAFGLRGFVEPVEDDASDAPTE
jgi:hypothetical protein